MSTRRHKRYEALPNTKYTLGDVRCGGCGSERVSFIRLLALRIAHSFVPRILVPLLNMHLQNYIPCSCDPMINHTLSLSLSLLCPSVLSRCECVCGLCVYLCEHRAYLKNVAVKGNFCYGNKLFCTATYGERERDGGEKARNFKLVPPATGFQTSKY